jgi:hypothetical protein
MPFGLKNGTATFSAYTDDCLPPYIDDFTMCYHDDMLIYSSNLKEHEDQVQKVLQHLQEFGPHGEAARCQFGVREVSFFGFVINSDGIGMESDSISRIEDWPTTESVRDVQVLHGFTNFYQGFIRKYANVMAPISNLPMTQGSRMSEWTQDAELRFRKLKKAFTEALILQHFKLQKLIILLTDASGCALAGILNLYNRFGILRPVNFYTRKCSPAEQNYDT